MKWFKGKKIDIIIIVLLYIVAVGSRFGSYFLVSYEKNKEFFRDENSIPYFHDMDSYYYASLTSQALESDHTYDLFRENNKYRYSYGKDDFHDYSEDKHIFLPFISATLYKFVSIFGSIPLDLFLSILTPLLYGLAVIPAYIFVRRKTNIMGGITAGIIVGLNASFMYYTGASSMDTDTLLFLLPLLYVLSFIEALYTERPKKKIIMSIISFVSLAMLLFTWNSGVIYIYLVLGVSLLLLILYLFKYRFRIKEYMKSTNIKMLLLTNCGYILIMMLIVGSFNIDLFTNVLGSSDKYPDAGLFVSEMGGIQLFSGGITGLIGIGNDSVINRCGGIFGSLLLIISIGIMLYELVRNRFKKSNIIVLFLLIWLTGGFISIFKGIRFYKILIIPVSLIIGLAMGQIYKLIKRKNLRIIVIFVLVVLILVPYIQGFVIALKQKPNGNDVLKESSEWIRDNTSEDAIIASWWDYGYYYEYVGKRKTLSDGGTYNGRYYYYLANAMQTEDINLTKGIFRMVATSGLTATYLLEDYLNEPKTAANLLLEILSKDKETARNIIKEKTNLTDKQITKILDYTHTKCEHDIILVISANMLNMNTVLDYYSSYDFENKELGSFYIVNMETVLQKLADSTEYEGVEHLKYFSHPIYGETINIWKLNYE